MEGEPHDVHPAVGTAAGNPVTSTTEQSSESQTE